VCISQFTLVENLKLLKQKKSLIIKQISAAKSKVLKYLDDIEERLITEVESVQEKHEEKINKEKHDEFGQCLTSIDFYLFMLCFH
jgi:glucose-6-phosphate-specific signal transduction histidine kinase